MKRSILYFIVYLFIIPLHSNVDAKFTASNNFVSTNFTSIEDGWYKSIVKYYNYNSGTRSTYTLNVKVEYNRVTVIDFGTDGSVHAGYNSSGYIYSGGYLSLERDFNNDVVGAYGKVSITLQNGNIITYDIDIE